MFRGIGRAKILSLLILGAFGAAWGAEELRIGPSYETAVDIPHIWAYLRRSPGGGPLMGTDGIIDAYFDTGASGLVLARESRDALGVRPEPNGVYYDIGVGGAQMFQVSEPLYISVANYTGIFDYPPLSAFTQQFGAYRLQLTMEYADDWLTGALDIFGMPLMMGKTVVIQSSNFDMLQFAAGAVHNPDDPALPTPDFTLKLRFRDFVYTTDPEIIPPLPTGAYNPVIDEITITRDGQQATGSYLLDTGAMVSMIAPALAHKLGLTELDGTPIIPPDDWFPLGGVGGSVNAPFYYLDTLRVPTLQGFDLVFEQPGVCVLQIGTYDEQTGDEIVLDGIFGFNFLDTYLAYDAQPFALTVLDTVRGTLGYKLNPGFVLPCQGGRFPYPAGDLNHDCQVTLADLTGIAGKWLATDCLADNCAGADLDRSGAVNLPDFTQLAGNVNRVVPGPLCGDGAHPWAASDFNRDCRTDLADLVIMTGEWLNSDCGVLTANCSGSDLDRNGAVDAADMLVFSQAWLTCTGGDGCW